MKVRFLGAGWASCVFRVYPTGPKYLYWGIIPQARLVIPATEARLFYYIGT